MGRRIILLFLISLFLTSCLGVVERALKSTDKEFILSAAKDQLNKKKYDEAIILFEKVTPLLTNIEEIKEVTYKTAEANFGEENYITAAHQFNVYHTNYPTALLAEAALFNSGLALYKLSPKYNLDQSKTEESIKRFQTFANFYPGSTKLAEANTKIDELRDKLETKAYQSGMLYYKIENFKSSSVQLTNFLNDFPDTKKREEALYLIFLSQFNVAMKSVEDKKLERIKDAIISYKNFVDFSPQSNKMSELTQKNQTLNTELNKINSN